MAITGDSLKACLISQLNRARKILPNKLTRCTKGRRRRSKGMKLTSLSFAGMEVSSQLKQVFKLIDSNGDGKLSPLELKQVLLNLGHEKAAAEEEAQGIVREMDCNGDGFVDLDEFMIVMENHSPNVIIEAFKVFDADNNGFISANELQRVLHRLGCRNCTVEDCTKMIRGVDKDGDGFVNFHEFKNMMTSGY